MHKAAVEKLVSDPLVRATVFSLDQWNAKKYGAAPGSRDYLKNASQETIAFFVRTDCLDALTLSVLLAQPEVNEHKVFDLGLPSIVGEVLEYLTMDVDDNETPLAKAARLADPYILRFVLADFAISLRWQAQQPVAESDREWIEEDLQLNAGFCRAIVDRGLTEKLPRKLLEAYVDAVAEWGRSTGASPTLWFEAVQLLRDRMQTAAAPKTPLPQPSGRFKLKGMP